MLEPFLTTNHLIVYVDGTIQRPEPKITTETAVTDNPSYSRWIANDAHVCMLILSTISEASFSMFMVRPLETFGFR